MKEIPKYVFLLSHPRKEASIPDLISSALILSSR